MSMTPRVRAWALLAMAGGVLLLQGAPAQAWILDLYYGLHHCPPPYVHCVEGPPRLCYKCVCPRPVCCPEGLPAWGYYQTCWQPWPYPPSCAHCPAYAPVAAQVQVVMPSPRGPMPPAGEDSLPGRRRADLEPKAEPPG
jgi:hypothetical protein